MDSSGFNWIDGLSPTSRNALLARARLRTFSEATVLYAQGDRVREFFQVVSGKVRKLVLDERGNEVLLYVYGPGDVVADSSAIDSSPYPVTISTQGETTLRIWNVDDLNELRQQSSEYDAALALQASRRLRGTLQLIQELVTMPVPARVASRLASLAELHETSTVDIELLLSQADLGLMIGAARQTVSSVVQELKDQGLLGTEYGKIVIHDLAALRSYARAASHKP